MKEVGCALHFVVIIAVIAAHVRLIIAMHRR